MTCDVVGREELNDDVLLLLLLWVDELEAKMMWLKNFERVQEIQQQIQWQPVTELEPRAFIPEVIRSAITVFIGLIASVEQIMWCTRCGTDLVTFDDSSRSHSQTDDQSRC